MINGNVFLAHGVSFTVVGWLYLNYKNNQRIKAGKDKAVKPAEKPQSTRTIVLKRRAVYSYAKAIERSREHAYNNPW